MDSLPRGATFKRIKTLWEIGLHVAGDPAARHTGNREMYIAVGSGSEKNFKPSLRMATGSPLLAHAIARDELDVAIINPSSLLTQAYRGSGLFAEPLPVRVLASYPSWDRFVILVHPRTGITSMAQLMQLGRPLRISIRKDPAHATRILIDQILARCGISLTDIESNGGSFHMIESPSDKDRLKGLRDGTIDAVFDEGISTWFEPALAAGLEPITLDEPVLSGLEQIGWRRAIIPAERFPSLKIDHVCLDFGGWPLYTRASLPEEQAYLICAALKEREAFIPWDERDYTGLAQLGRDTEATPLDVPLHPGAERWYREQRESGSAEPGADSKEANGG
jgi:TRAP-type uncharacterized transport system substrate-binding protein